MLDRRPMHVRSQSVGPLLAVVRNKGGDATALRERFNLSVKAETDTDIELPVPVLRGLFDAAAVLVGDPNVGMHAALALPKGRYGLVEYAAFSAPTLWHGLECLVRFSALISRASSYQLTRTRTGIQISHVVRGFSDGLGRQVNEFTVTSFVQMSRAAVRAPIVPRRVWFAHPAPPQLDEHRQVFGTDELLFNADTSGVDFDAAVADAPMPSADPYLLGLIEKQAAIELANERSDETLTSRAHVVIREKVRTGAPTVGAVASALHMSPRTLQRKLADEGVAFQRLVDTVREDVARTHLSHGTSLGEIAFRLGYADMGSFLRAFKRWTGTTPTEFRKSSSAAPAHVTSGDA